MSLQFVHIRGHLCDLLADYMLYLETDTDNYCYFGICFGFYYWSAKCTFGSTYSIHISPYLPCLLALYSPLSLQLRHYWFKWFTPFRLNQMERKHTWVSIRSLICSYVECSIITLFLPVSDCKHLLSLVFQKRVKEIITNFKECWKGTFQTYWFFGFG